MASGQMNAVGGTSSDSIRKPDTDNSVYKLIEKAQSMGLTDDIRDLVDDVDSLKSLLTAKNYELDILEIISMQSDDDNIIELRNQLFTMVKLIHSDIIKDMIEQYELEMGRNDDGGFWFPDQDESKSRQKMDNQTLINKVRSAWYKRKEAKRLTKIARQQIKEHLDMGETPDYIDLEPEE